MILSQKKDNMSFLPIFGHVEILHCTTSSHAKLQWDGCFSKFRADQSIWYLSNLNPLLPFLQHTDTQTDWQTVNKNTCFCRCWSSNEGWVRCYSVENNNTNTQVFSFRSLFESLFSQNVVDISHQCLFCIILHS